MSAISNVDSYAALVAKGRILYNDLKARFDLNVSTERGTIRQTRCLPNHKFHNSRPKKPSSASKYTAFNLSIFQFDYQASY